MFSPNKKIRITNRIDHLPKRLDQLDLKEALNTDSMVLESASLEDVENTWLFGCDVITSMMLEAFKSKASNLKHRVELFSKQLNDQLTTLKQERAPGTARSPLPVEISKPRKSGSVAVQIAKISISDGQSISIAFHAPDNDPLKINDTDTLIAFRFMLNSRDITHVVAPKGNQDISLKEATGKLAQLLEANTNKFKASKEKRATQSLALRTAQENAEKLQEEGAAITLEADTLAEQLKKAEKKESILQKQIKNQDEIQEELRKQIAEKRKQKTVSVTPPASTSPTEEPETAPKKKTAQDANEVLTKFHNSKLEAINEAAKLILKSIKSPVNKKNLAKLELGAGAYAKLNPARIELRKKIELIAEKYHDQVPVIAEIKKTIEVLDNVVKTNKAVFAISQLKMANLLNQKVLDMLQEEEPEVAPVSDSDAINIITQPNIKRAIEHLNEVSKLTGLTGTARDMLSSMSTAIQIDTGEQRGYNRSAFTTSIYNKLKTVKKSGSQDFIDALLTVLNEVNKVAPKPIFTNKHGIWALGNYIEDINSLNEPKKIVDLDALYKRVAERIDNLSKDIIVYIKDSPAFTDAPLLQEHRAVIEDTAKELVQANQSASTPSLKINNAITELDNAKGVNLALNALNILANSALASSELEQEYDQLIMQMKERSDPTSKINVESLEAAFQLMSRGEKGAFKNFQEVLAKTHVNKANQPFKTDLLKEKRATHEVKRRAYRFIARLKHFDPNAPKVDNLDFNEVQYKSNKLHFLSDGTDAYYMPLSAIAATDPHEAIRYLKDTPPKEYSDETIQQAIELAAIYYNINVRTDDEQIDFEIAEDQKKAYQFEIKRFNSEIVDRLIEKIEAGLEDQPLTHSLNPDLKSITRKLESLLSMSDEHKEMISYAIGAINFVKDSIAQRDTLPGSALDYWREQGLVSDENWSKVINALDKKEKKSYSKLHWYGLQARPYSFGTVPNDRKVKKYLDSEAALKQFPSAGDKIRHGAIGYESPLTKKDIDAFELQPLSDKDSSPYFDSDYAESIIEQALNAYLEKAGLKKITSSELKDKINSGGLVGSVTKFKGAFAPQLREQYEFLNRKVEPDKYKAWNATVEAITTSQVLDKAEKMGIFSDNISINGNADEIALRKLQPIANKEKKKASALAVSSSLQKYIAQEKKAGRIPKGVQFSVRKTSEYSILIQLKELPDNINLFAHSNIDISDLRKRSSLSQEVYSLIEHIESYVGQYEGYDAISELSNGRVHIAESLLDEREDIELAIGEEEEEEGEELPIEEIEEIENPEQGPEIEEKELGEQSDPLEQEHVNNLKAILALESLPKDDSSLERQYLAQVNEADAYFTQIGKLAEYDQMLDDAFDKIAMLQ